ncbi:MULTISPECIES: type II toxin-antitoxin system HicA family toxin [Photorhabdus]|uniref:Addiction module toxin, HicA family n=3 Tax=Photorhabdus TaxID=29487 RepID=A0ABX0AW09_9GAMM|nr:MULTISPECIES: type II toxin-antitoxin system HicA family toxin [Photorhabdus]EYU15941.1 YcfA-like protein [Photorhabdus aegyptia]MCC8376177.1 type II toxin-antitoxin system HicA family toxin [Photorhabdus bodei]MCC8466566.1 type II toxin-antitoxin system HicA family toxin [Photorhabdus bodei]MCT8351171.1 type II toxin-antitoxin system HicA family toxin [Photorhabdus kayaii]MDB6370310.1 type II toxin-antitoxin system HicA family toxin [Photorhabdus bodei]
MSKAEKLIEKFLNSQKTFEWSELVVLLSLLNYEKQEKQGSRVRFFNESLNHTILMHRPHPENYIKGGTLKAVKQTLKEVGLI